MVPVAEPRRDDFHVRAVRVHRQRVVRVAPGTPVPAGAHDDQEPRPLRVPLHVEDVAVALGSFSRVAARDGARSLLQFGGGDEGAEFEEGRGVRPQVEDVDAVLLTF